MTDFEGRNGWALLRSQLECPECHEILASIHRHDFVTCRCGATVLDGGLDYMRIAGNWIGVLGYEEREKLNHSLFIAGPHNKASKMAALEVYKALWEATARGKAPANAREVQRATVERGIRHGTSFGLTYSSVRAYLNLFAETQAVEKTTKGWLAKVPLVERADAP